MPLNPFFQQGSPPEQFLIQDLINEHVKIYGVDIYYLPRKIFQTDDIIREVQSSKFDDSFLLEAYINNYEGYAPGSDIMSKFGVTLKNEVSLTISRERYEEFIAPFLEGITSGIREGRITDFDFGDLIARPKEGDLIYFPLGERLFEIKRVEHEKPFYQLGTNYIYELQCELYEYADEIIDTTIEEIDNTIEDEGYITTVKVVSRAQNASGVAATSTGYIREIFLNNDGYGYTSTPSVVISPSSFGQNASAVAITTSIGGVQSISEIRLLNAGSGYTEPPTISIIGGGGVGAAATCSIEKVSAGVNAVSVSGGTGYLTIPSVTFSSPGDPDAVAAEVSNTITTDISFTFDSTTLTFDLTAYTFDSN